MKLNLIFEIKSTVVSDYLLALALKLIKYFRKEHNFEKLSLTECSNLMMDD